MRVKGARKTSLATEQLQKGQEFWIPGEGVRYRVWGADYTPHMEYGFILIKGDNGRYDTLQIQRGKVKRILPSINIENVQVFRENRMI